MEDTNRLLIELPEELVGERVIVRPYRKGDGAAACEAIHESKDHLLPWMPWALTLPTPDESEARARKCRIAWDAREDLAVGVWSRDNGRYLGGSGLHRIDWRIRSFEIGYWVRASETGKGYITESTRLLTKCAFEDLGANRVFIRVADGNTRSAAIPMRLGFRHEGTLRNALIDADGKLWNCLVFGMTPEEWSSGLQVV